MGSGKQKGGARASARVTTDDTPTVVRRYTGGEREKVRVAHFMATRSPVSRSIASCTKPDVPLQAPVARLSG